MIQRTRETWPIPTYLTEDTRYPSVNFEPTITKNTKLQPIIPTDALITKLTKSWSKLGVCELNESNGLPSSFIRPFPHIIIIGFGKSGTRALYQMIRMHPDIVGPSNEIRFFSNDVNYKRGLQYYLGQLPTSNESQKIIVKSPDYIIKPLAAFRLQKALSQCHRRQDIKFIVIFRDPFKRAVSEYLEWKIQLFHQRRKTLPPFEKLCVKTSGQINSLNKQVNNFCCHYLCIDSYTPLLKENMAALKNYIYQMSALRRKNYGEKVHLLLFIPRKHTIITTNLKLINAKIYSF